MLADSMLEMEKETTNRKCSIENRSWKYRKIHGKALESFLVKILAIRATVITKTPKFFLWFLPSRSEQSFYTAAPGDYFREKLDLFA